MKSRIYLDFGRLLSLKVIVHSFNIRNTSEILATFLQWLAMEHSRLSIRSFLTRELRACARASCSYDVGNTTRSLARLVDSCKLFFDFRLLSAFDSFW